MPLVTRGIRAELLFRCVCGKVRNSAKNFSRHDVCSVLHEKVDYVLRTGDPYRMQGGDGESCLVVKAPSLTYDQQQGLLTIEVTRRAEEEIRELTRRIDSFALRGDNPRCMGEMVCQAGGRSISGRRRQQKENETVTRS